MKKAILITALNKQYNKRYLTLAIGKVQVFNASNFPPRWRHIVLDQEGEIDRAESWVKEAFNTAAAVEFHAEAGFYPINEPPFNSATQYLGEPIPDGDSAFTYEVIDYTPEELQAIAQQAIDEIEEDNKFGGLDEWRKIQRQLREAVAAEQLTDAQVAQIKARFLKEVNPIFSGDWDAAYWNLQQIDFNAITAPNKVKNTLNQLKTKFENYFNNNYQRSGK